MSVGGKSMLRVMGQLRLYFDPTGFAAARMDVRAFKVVMMPALAIDTVCCSCGSSTVRDHRRRRRAVMYVP